MAVCPSAFNPSRAELAREGRQSHYFWAQHDAGLAYLKSRRSTLSRASEVSRAIKGKRSLESESARRWDFALGRCVGAQVKVDVDSECGCNWLPFTALLLREVKTARSSAFVSRESC